MNTEQTSKKYFYVYNDAIKIFDEIPGFANICGIYVTILSHF